MTPTRPPWLHWLPLWPRGIRSRLVATYLLAAIALVIAGVALFNLELGRGLRANVDAGLQTRAATLATDLASGAVERIEPPPVIKAAPRGATNLQAITAVYDPGGRIVDAEPAVLPASPLTTEQQLRPPSVTTVRTTRYSGESFRILTQPVHRPDGTWLVVVGVGLSATDQASDQVGHALLVAVPVLLVLVGIGAWLLSGAALRPVDRMRADAQNLGEHDSTGRITEPPTRDSLNHLARTFNALLDRLHQSLQRQRALVADAGHELRTPLAVLQTELETAVRPNRSRADLIDSINHARQEVERLTRLSEDLLLLAEADGGQPLVQRQLTDVTNLLYDVDRAYRSHAIERNVTLTTQPPSAIIADVDPVALRRILDNLITNALRHTPPGGAIQLVATLEDVGDGNSMDGATSGVLQVQVSDSGPGFPSEFLPYAFDRFGRADQARTRSGATSGSGLGLAIVATLAAAHAGAVTAANRPGGGASIIVRLPSSPDILPTSSAAIMDKR
jgi:signal transduction histidine kinase